MITTIMMKQSGLWKLVTKHHHHHRATTRIGSIQDVVAVAANKSHHYHHVGIPQPPQATISWIRYSSSTHHACNWTTTTVNTVVMTCQNNIRHGHGRFLSSKPSTESPSSSEGSSSPMSESTSSSSTSTTTTSSSESTSSESQQLPPPKYPLDMPWWKEYMYNGTPELVIGTLLLVWWLVDRYVLVPRKKQEYDDFWKHVQTHDGKSSSSKKIETTRDEWRQQMYERSLPAQQHQVESISQRPKSTPSSSSSSSSSSPVLRPPLYQAKIVHLVPSFNGPLSLTTAVKQVNMTNTPDNNNNNNSTNALRVGDVVDVFQENVGPGDGYCLCRTTTSTNTATATSTVPVANHSKRWFSTLFGTVKGPNNNHPNMIEEEMEETKQKVEPQELAVGWYPTYALEKIIIMDSRQKKQV